MDEALIIEVNSSRNHFYLFTVCMLDEIFKEWKCPRSSVNVLCGQLFQTRLDIGGNDLRFISSFLGCRVFNICKNLSVAPSRLWNSASTSLRVSEILKFL